MIRILTFNVLADAYDASTLTFDERRERIVKAIFLLDPCVVLLQEVDHWNDFYEEVFSSEGFSCHYFQRPSREDGIATLFKSEKFEIDDHVELNYDDIADNLASQGFHNAASFRRQNVGLLVKLRLKGEGEAGKNIVVGNTHLYWSPAKPEVKLAQARMLLESITKLACTSVKDEYLPMILGGDFNSVPTSDLYQRITTGNIFRGSLYGDYRRNDMPVRFVADTSLKKLCSWLRLLGVDCAMESDESELARTSKPINNFLPLFSLARSECRIILTSSRKLTERANCPLCFYVKTTNFEAALAEIVRTFEVEISEHSLLTVCGKCGGKITKSTREKIRAAFEKQYLPDDDRPLFQCVECQQPYWWNERVDSSPARAMRVASRLHSIIKKDDEGEEIEGKSASMPSSVYATGLTDQERELRNDFLTSETSEKDQHSADLDKMFEVRDAAIVDQDEHEHTEKEEEVKAEESIPLKSAYVMANEEEATMTNWSGDFKGCLDYVFLSKNDFRVHSSGVVPRFDGEGESKEFPYAIESYAGSPSILWPSDHFIMYADVEL
jgi:mRNA deadenylase 3'-5' endonuclease subunit Ccr4/uncharacterized protein with PIN domain